MPEMDLGRDESVDPIPQHEEQRAISDQEAEKDRTATERGARTSSTT
jgi:hypothetical protein